MITNNFGKKFFIVLIGAGLILFVLSFLFSSESSYSQSLVGEPLNIESKEKIIRHIETPESVKSIYMTQCVAGTPSLREKLVKLAEETEINSIVIDIKDYTGTVAFDFGENFSGGSGCRVSDLKEFVEKLHDKNIYVIGRVTVFQDPYYSKTHPELAVKKKSDGSVWKDRKGLSFIDPGAKPFWDYIVSIAKASHDIGFDEINFDYIRFPSDGNMEDIYFSHSLNMTKREALKSFFEYLDAKMTENKIVTSADLFGMTTTNTDDLNIGQVLEYALLNFDYVAPMVYPSHYPPKFNGWPDPNKVPYEIIKYSMDSAVSRANSLKTEVVNRMYTENASTTEKIKNEFYNEKLEKRLGKKQLRPWLQDFDYPVPYTTEMVRTQIQATYDVGLDSWMLWDPSNRYTREALLSE